MSEPIRVLVVDDEPLGRERVRELLAQERDVELIGECSNGLQAVEAIESTSPDVVFLDVQMPELDGIGVVEAIGEQRCPHVVFVTAYDKYMERAFEVHAIDYLRKPYVDERFHAALRYARERVEERRGREADTDTNLFAKLEVLLQQSGRGTDRLVIREKESGEFRVVRTQEVEWIEAEEGHVRVHVGKTVHLWRKTLTEVEHRLDPRVFLRLHRSFIVNSTRIRTVTPLWKGEYTVTLESGKKLGTGRSYRAVVEAFLERA